MIKIKNNLENMHKKLLKLDRMREKKTYFLFFLNEEFLDFFSFFF